MTPKSLIHSDDLLVFRNGRTAQFSNDRLNFISQFYDDNLHCITDADFDIVQILRPTYITVYDASLEIKSERSLPNETTKPKVPLHR